MILRSTLSTPRLVHLLAGWTHDVSGASRQDVAERLAPWLGVPDAIALHAAHQAVGAPAGAQAPLEGERLAQALGAQFRQLRSTLENAIVGAAPAAPIAGTGSAPGGRSLKTRTPAQPAPPEAPGFGPWQQRYLERQRRMDLGIEALRAHVRQSLARASPRLAQLAALDAALEPTVGPRAQRLLATVPAFLERRFEQLRASPGDGDDGRWRATFEQDFQAALLAELDLRLQPVVGLLEALNHEVTTWQ